MTSLPNWITPRMKENFAKIIEELMLYESDALFTIGTNGVMAKRNTRQPEEYIGITILAQDTDFLDGFLTSETSNWTPPVEKPLNEVEDCTSLADSEKTNEDISELFETFVNSDGASIEYETIEPGLTLDPEEFRNSSLLKEDVEVVNQMIASIIENEFKVSSEEDQSKTNISTNSKRNDIWKEQLIDAMRKIHEGTLDSHEKIIQYYRIGKWIANPPVQHRGRLFIVKNEVNKALGIRLTERPYAIARNTYKLYENEEQIKNLKTVLSPTTIRRLTNDKIEEMKKSL